MDVELLLIRYVRASQRPNFFSKRTRLGLSEIIQDTRENVLFWDDRFLNA